VASGDDNWLTVHFWGAAYTVGAFVVLAMPAWAGYSLARDAMRTEGAMAVPVPPAISRQADLPELPASPHPAGYGPSRITPPSAGDGGLR
jgi:hypothetical protein